MKLIDKNKVDKILEYTEEYDCAYRDGINAVLHVLKKRIDTLEVKESGGGRDVDDKEKDTDTSTDAFIEKACDMYCKVVVKI